MLLWELGIVLDKKDYLQLSESLFGKIRRELTGEKATYYGSWAVLAGWFGHGTKEVAIAGADAVQLNQTLQKNYLPLAIFLGTVKEEFIPLLKEKVPDEKTLIYVCEKGTCKRPVDDPMQALEQINKQ